MREIKFRGKNLDNPEEWLYGYIIPVSDIRTFMVSGKSYSLRRDFNEVQFPCHRVLDRTIGMKTGLKDRNDVDIYEGDIISVNTCKKLVGWDEKTAGFGLKNLYDLKYPELRVDWQHPNAQWWKDREIVIEIIGNIHDNPELLETED